MTSTYDLQVVATDQGLTPFAITANVAVTLQPVNEFVPQFTGAPYTETLAESSSMGTVLPSVVSATDSDSATTGDGQIRYFIDPPNDKFEISSNGGIILTGELNYESMISPFQITLTIFAEDLGENPEHKSASTSYVITVTNVNDIYAECDQTIINVYQAEDPSVTSGNLATLLCADSEADTTMGYAVYSVNGLTSYSGTPAFAMTGNVLGFSGGFFDFDATNFYEVRIAVTDHASTPLTTFVDVRIFVTKTVTNDPTFSPSSYTLNVDENQNAGTLVGDIDTTTEGTNTVYSLIGTTLFSIDPLNGKIYTTKSLDAESSLSHSFVVQATATESTVVSNGLDGYTNLPVNVTVNDLNDNAPAFASEVYTVTVTEGSTATVSLITSDNDATAANNVIASASIDTSYNGGSDSASFVYGSDTLTINGNNALDYELGTRNFEIRLEVVDSGSSALTGTCTVYVKIENANEATPVWASGTSFTVEEGQPVGTTVTTISGTDADSNDTGDGVLRYEFTTSNSDFSIGYTTGEFKIKAVSNYISTL